MTPRGLTVTSNSNMVADCVNNRVHVVAFNKKGSSFTCSLWMNRRTYLVIDSKGDLLLVCFKEGSTWFYYQLFLIKGLKLDYIV